MHASTVAIDLAKDVFELAFADDRGRVLERKRLSRRAFARVLEQRPPLRVLMEACGSAHYWARRFQRLGHAVGCCPPATYARMCGATRPTATMWPGYWKRTAAATSPACRSRRPSNRASRPCTAYANTSRPSAPPRSTCYAVCCANSG